MNLRQIEAFRAVMTEGSVTQAAVALGVTQPAVSCLIANLEESMGFLLFKRHRGLFQPTGEAEIFLEDAERLLASHSRATRTARDIRDLKSGSLRVAALPAVSMNFMPKLIAGFIRDRPQIKVSLQTRSSVQIREWISAQLFDIGFAELPANDPAMDIDPLSFDCVCALPAGHPLASKTRLDPHDLKGEPLIVLNPEHSTHYHLKAAFEAAGVPFEKRVGRMMEGLRLCKALWSGEPVDWDGRWKVEQGVLAPTPHRPGGPPIWGGGSAVASRQRAGKHFDGWFPTGPDATGWGEQWRGVLDSAREAGRNPDDLTGALYLTMYIDNDVAKAEKQIETYMEEYYGASAKVLARHQASYGGPVAGAAAWLKGYADQGASHIVLRFAGDHEMHMDAVAEIRASLGW